AVDRGLQERLLDLVDGQAVPESGPHVHGQLLVMAAGDQRGERDQRAAAPAEAGPGPDGTPGVPGDELLEVAAEVGGFGGGAVDVLGAEHLAPDLHPVVVAGHETSFASSRMSVATSSGASAGAWCPTFSSTTNRPFCTPSAISRSES